MELLLKQLFATFDWHVLTGYEVKVRVGFEPRDLPALWAS